MVTTKEILSKLHVTRGRSLDEGRTIIVEPNRRVRGAYAIEIYGETLRERDRIATLQAWPRSHAKAVEYARALSTMTGIVIGSGPIRETSAVSRVSRPSPALTVIDGGAEIDLRDEPEEPEQVRFLRAVGVEG